MSADRDAIADATEKELLVGILTQLQYQNRLLAELTDAEVDTQSNQSEPEYECSMCGTVVLESEREQHGKDKHKYHGNMTPAVLSGMYERLNK